MTKAELIADLVAKNASKEEITQIRNTPESELIKAGLIEGKINGDANQGVDATSKNTTPENTELESETGFLDLPIEDKEEPIISKEEFSIFKGDDVEDRVSNLVNSKLAHKNITAKPAKGGVDAIKVINSVGAEIIIPLYTEDNTTGSITYPIENADIPYDELINFISQPVDQKQADIYSKTKLKANEEGSYAVGIQQDYNVTQGEDPVL